MIEFKGKLLVRRAVNSDGKPVLVIAGVVETNAPIDQFDPNDEMWAAHIGVLDAIKFVNKDGMDFSPEDFIENHEGVQNKERWTHAPSK